MHNRYSVFAALDSAGGMSEPVRVDHEAERLRQYFLTYKLVPGQPAQVTIDEVYDADPAHRVVEAAIADYAAEFGSAVT